MATTPTLPKPESYNQILGDMLANFATKTGIPSVSVGSASLSLLETMALSVSRSSGDVFQTILNSSLQYATGSSLQAIAAEFGVTPTVSQVATGYVNVTDTSFQVVSTSVYPGATPVNAGSLIVYASSNTGFPSTGSIYIGRGTNNSEGPIPYSSIVAIGNYFQFNLTTPTQKFHNFNESIILSQGGNRTVPINTIVVAPSNGLQPATQFTVTQTATILDGAAAVTNIPITALTPGSSGNVPGNSISAFSSPPFSNATVVNVNATSGGTDPETDDQLRTQIQNVLSSIGLGTALALENSLIGASSTTEAATITSDKLVSNLDGSSTIYISTGSSIPYEAKTAGVAIEYIVTSAIGGEKLFQLATGGTQAPVAKAFLQSTNGTPFAIYGGYVLAVTVGGVTTEHTFQTSDFQAPGAATAYEICASINADTLIKFQATTAGNGTYVVIRSIAESRESIEVTIPASPTAINANLYLGFPTTLSQTLRLYKNHIPLSEDGSTASVFSAQQGTWSSSITNGETLIISVDGTAAITYIILNSDFIATGLYNTVSAFNSLQSWADVFNNKITGITATVSGSQIEITSNRGATNKAQIVISPSSSLVTKSMFTVTEGLSSTGAAADYVLNRNTAQFELVTPLAAGDSLSAGIQNTRGTILSAELSGGSVNLSSEGYIWLAIDEPVTIINTGVTAGSLLAVSVSGNLVSYTSNTVSAFSNVVPGDYVIIWSAELNVSNRLEGRVHSITTTSVANDTLNILVTSTEAAAIVPQSAIVYKAGFVVANMQYAPQKFNVPAGTQTLDAISLYLQSQTDSLTFGVYIEEYLTISTNTLNTSGQVTVVTFDTVGAALSFTEAQSNTSSYPLLGYQDTASAYLPSFFHSTISSGISASPPDSFLTSFTSTIPITGREPDEIITFINPYGTIDDEQPANEVVQETSLSGSVVGFTKDPDVRRLRVNDRYFLSSPLSFGNNDSVVVIIDNNPVTNTFQVPLYRSALTNTTYGVNPHNFNAYDSALAPTGNFTTSFGSSFSFNNYEVLMQAKKTISGNTLQSSILYRSTLWGASGENIEIGYIYPTSANSILSNIVTVTDVVTVLIVLSSGAAVGTTIGPTTQWNVSIASNTPSAGIDEVTYTYNGTGSNPNLTSLAAGQYVNINSQTGFNSANQGTFLITSVTVSPQSFTVEVPTGTAFAQTNVVTIATNGMNFYSAGTSTATDIAAYVNANLSSYVSATVVNDGSGGTPGAGIIKESTYQNNNFTAKTIGLLDGVNWLLSSNLPSSPQFVLKNALALPTDVGYAFNNGEKLLFTPTTIDQVNKFINISAVSGITTSSVLNAVNRDSQLELSSETYGSGGYIQIVGGSANGYSFPVINSALNINNTYASINASSISSSSVLSGQWFFLQASNVQQKEIEIGNNSDVTIVTNYPTVGYSAVTLSNRILTQRYFGAPRSINLNGLTFRVEAQGELVCFSYVNSTSTSQYLDTPINFSSTTGDTFTVSLVPNSTDAQYTITSGTTTFANVPIGNLITINIPSSPQNSGTFMVSGSSSSILQVTNSNAVALGSTVVTAGTTFTGTTGVMEGDSVIIGAPFSAPNQGTYRVIRTFNDSFWIKNTDYVEEQITLSGTSLAFYEYEATIPGDSLVISGTSLGATNAGTYPIVSVENTGNFVSFYNQILSTTGNTTLNSNQITVASVTGLVIGQTIIGTYIPQGTTITGITGLNVFMSNTATGNTGSETITFYSSSATLVTTGDITTSSNQLTNLVSTSGLANNQLILGAFIPYGTIVSSFIGTTVTMSSNATNTVNNLGTYYNTVIVTGILNPITGVSLNGLTTSFYVDEGTAYTGYKQAYLVALQPGSNTLNQILFTTYLQYEKINQAAGVEVTALNKLNFPTTVSEGLDAYKYNTGLIQEANRIVYGDPTDNLTFPGVAAAGSSIFIQEPLALVVNLAIDIRLQTGAPFSSISQQIQTNVAALINSNPVGQSIALGSIVAVCMVIPGIVSVAISSPLYSPTDDLIVVQPEEQTFVLNPSQNISVSIIGA